MNRRWFAIFVLLGTLGILTPAALADHGKGHGKRNAHAKQFDRDDDRWEHHDRYDLRIYNIHEGRPPGWRVGRKTGWGNCGLPPGQAKKYGCRTYVYEGYRYYYYRDDVGRTIVRRPGIEVHAVIR